MDRMVLYSPEVLYAVIGHYNMSIFPAQIIAALLALLMLGLVLATRRRGGPVVVQVSMSVMGAFWIWCALAWFADHYRSINWAAFYYAIAFSVQAAALLGYGALARRREQLVVSRHLVNTSLALAAFALLAHPVIERALGLTWQQVQYAGVSPDPTAVFTLGLLLAFQRLPLWLTVVPVIWLILSAVWSILLGTPERLILPIMGIAVISLLMVSGKMRDH